MNNQSDYGYAIGGLEVRTPRTCLAQAAFCRAEAKRRRGTKFEPVFWNLAREWIKECRHLRNYYPRKDW
jgi:hypothetical protein